MTRVLAIVLAVLGLAYACLWWSFERFYEQFSVSPQDVGLAPSGNASNIAGAALQLGVWLLIALAVLTLLPVAAVMAVEVAVASGRARRVVLIAAAAAAVLLGLTAFLYWWLVDNQVGLILLAVAAAVFGLLRFLVRLLAKFSPSEKSAPADAGVPDDAGRNAVSAVVGWSTPRLALIVALAAAVVGMTFIDLPTDAAQAGECASGRGRYRHLRAESVPALNLPLPGLHLPVLSVHAQPATLAWLAGSPPAGLPSSKLGDVVYLGQASGSIVVYDRVSHTPIRIPASDVVISLNVAKECPGVH
jgi:hypothetical protein